MVVEGYKNTEVGVIPEDWNVSDVGELLNFKNGLNKASEFFGYGTPIINYMDVFNNQGLYEKDVKGKVYLNNDEKRSFSAIKGDVFFTRTSETQQEIGISSVLLEEIKGCVFSGFVLRGRSKTKKVDFHYYKYCFTHQYIRIQIISTSSFTTRALTNGRYLSAVKMALPPTIEEQKAIAKVLTDTDNLIAGLDNLIAKKKTIKKGAMQQLLTPPNKEGKRLSGFSGDWVEKSLGEVCDINMGQSPLSEFYNDASIGLPLVQGNADIKKRRTIIRNYTSQITKRAFKNDIIMSVRAPVGEIALALFDCCIGRGVCSIKYVNDFIYHFLINYESSWSKLSTGSTFDSVNSEQVRGLKVDLPPTLKEQEAIATILSDMDNDIETLETKKEKYKQLKQGLAQELLTGKTRLV